MLVDRAPVDISGQLANDFKAGYSISQPSTVGFMSSC